MRYERQLLSLTFGMILFSCKKDQPSHETNPPTVPPNPPAQHVLLKDIIIPHLPSPYYHFEYNSDSLVTKVDFASGYSIYDVFYADNKISELRNNIIVNHDTLRYLYDPAGKLVFMKFISQSNVVYRLVSFAYDGDLVKEIDWAVKESNIGYFIDRILTFTYYPGGNVKTMIDRRPDTNGSPAHTNMTLYEKYDNKTNVDDFSIIHDSFHDHLFLLQGFRLQNNNPGKETLFVDSVGLYTVDYTYVYNPNNTPSTKMGSLMFTSGPDSGKIFQTNTAYTYY